MAVLALWQGVYAQCPRPQFSRTVHVTNPNGTALTNYVVKVQVNTAALQGAGKLTNKFGMVFYDENCTTQLNYWPSDADAFPTANATYYVKVPNLPANASKQIHLYYDNATTCTQVVTNTFSALGNSSTITTPVGFSAATTWELTNLTFPTNSTTYRWDIRATATGTIRPKTTYTLAGNQYVQSDGTSRSLVVGLNTLVDEIPVNAGGHPGFYTPSLLQIGQNCGLCNAYNSGSGDIPPNTAPLTANSANSARILVYYRPRAAAEPTTTLDPEYNRNTPVTISPTGYLGVCEGDYVTLTASTPFVRYEWYLDNVLVTTGTNPTQGVNTTGMTPGLHQAKVVAFHSECDSVQATKDIFINPTPRIDSLQPDAGCEGTLLNFSAGITTLGAVLVGYHWNFGDGNTSTAISPAHRYAISGGLDVTHAVISDSGCVDTLIEPIEVWPKPVINAVFETDICWPQPAEFTHNTTIPGNWNSSVIVAEDWDFGDASTGSGSVVQHAYAVPNQYTETLEVTTNYGCKDTLAGSVDIWPKPQILTVTEPDICWPEIANYNGTYTIPNNWNSAFVNDESWRFGDGTTGLGIATTHYYAIPALYADSLILTTTDQCRDTVAENLAVFPKPFIDSVWAEDICWPQPVQYQGFLSIPHNWTSTSIIAQDWAFGDAQTATGNPVSHAFAVANNYTYTFEVETGDACRDTFSDPVNVWPKPQINTLTETDNCWPNEVLFWNNTTIPANWNNASIQVWDWRKGDGTTSPDSAFGHFYAIPGHYFDTLYTTTTDQCRDTLTGDVEVWPKPSIDSVNVADVCEPEVVQFTSFVTIPHNWNTAAIARYNWQFGDGNQSSQANPNHQYAVAGAYNVTLEVITTDSCRDTLVLTVNVFPKPVADYTAPDICFGDSLRITNNSTVSGTLGATLQNYFWSFGDGNTSTAFEPAHAYNFDGVYALTLVTTTNHGCRDTLIQSLNVYPKPRASFEFGTTCQPDSVRFIDASTVSTGIIAQYDWNFGDGGMDSVQNPVYAYAIADTYAVTLEVTTLFGCRDTLVLPITYNPKPQAAFAARNICYPDSARFTDQTLIDFGNVAQWTWDFGDGNTSNTPNPAHAYAVADTYAVTLTVVSDSGCADTIVQNLISHEKPQAGFSPHTVCWPDTARFADTTALAGNYSLVAWQWTFGDGDSATTPTVDHYFERPDTYAVTLIVWSDSGCSDTSAIPFVAFPPPGLDIGPDTIWLCPYNPITLHAGPQFVQYLWQDGSTDSTYYVDTVGIYMVSIVDTNGCPQSDTVTMPLAPKPDLVFPRIDSLNLCAGTVLPVDAATPTILAWQWSTLETSSNIDITAAGTYTVIGWNFYGCTDTTDLVVTEIPLPVVDLGPDTGFCHTIPFYLDARGNFQTWQWSNGSTADTLALYNGGNFTVAVTDSLGCVGTDTITVERYPLPLVNLGPDSSLCQGDAMQFQVGTQYVNYAWSTGEATDAITVSVAGLVFVEVTDTNGCINTSNMVTVTVDPLPAKPVITKEKDETPLISTPEHQYQWYIDEATLPNATAQQWMPLETGHYQVLVTDTNGCYNLSDSFFIQLEIYEAEMYQAITPNGDGLNDRFTIPSIEYYPKNELVIYGRWGQEVFRKQPYLNEFVGQNEKGQNLPDGTYYYTLDFGDGQPPIKGYLVIHR